MEIYYRSCLYRRVSAKNIFLVAVVHLLVVFCGGKKASKGRAALGAYFKWARFRCASARTCERRQNKLLSVLDGCRTKICVLSFVNVVTTFVEHVKIVKSICVSIFNCTLIHNVNETVYSYLF